MVPQSRLSSRPLLGVIAKSLKLLDLIISSFVLLGMHAFQTKDVFNKNW